jgi:hypothetical protein
MYHLQVNINSLTGQYGPGARSISERLIDRGMITFLDQIVTTWDIFN